MTVVVKGYKELSKALVNAPKDVKREVRTVLRRTGEDVRDDAEQRFSNYGPPASRQSHSQSAVGYMVAVRQRGVEVDSRRKKTTGAHSEYGNVQMRRGLIPALDAKRPIMYARMEVAMQEVIQILERRSL
jgi:hypothetical protein